MYVCIYLSIYLSICQYIYLSLFESIYLSIYLSIMGGAFSVMVIIVENEYSEVRFQDKIICIPHCPNIFAKSMNSSVLSLCLQL